MTMQYRTSSARTWWRYALAVSLLAATGVALGADDPRQATNPNQNQIWQQGLDLVERGDFNEAAVRLRKVPRGVPLTDKVLTWLEEFEKEQVDRKAMDKVDFEKYVRYAKERMERKEYNLALNNTILAHDVAADRDELLKADWLATLTKEALAKAKEYRKESEWRDAWRIYSSLSTLYEREPRYQKLEREVQTLWRLDTMFEEDHHWEEQIEKVRWEDAEMALEYIGDYYVQEADFKLMCETALEQLLILADSKSAQKQFDQLADDDDRHDFKARIQAKLDQVRTEPGLDRRACTRHFRRVIRDINKQTVRLPESLVVSELMRGALEPLDDYTTVIWPAAEEEFRKHTQGDFIGVGISIVKNRLTDEIEVVTPLEDSPAYRAGVQAGDIITLVNGKPLKGFSINKVVSTITGPRGSEVVMTVRRGDKDIEFPLKRDRIKIVSVKGQQRDPDHETRWNHWLDKEEGVGYVRLTNFQRNTYEDMTNVLSELEANGMRGLVLDLRGNPGGLLDSAWNISSLFLKRRDVVVSTKGRERSENQTFTAPHEGPYSDLPVVVLTDEASASASEIVAGAIRDNGRGIVVGERTFGKFSVQNLIPLGRSKAKLKITTAKYYLPSGVSLHRDPTADTWGVEPDVPLRLVRKEWMNLYLMWREAERIGPAKEKVDEDDAQAKADDKDGDKDKVDKEEEKDKDAVADADAAEKKDGEKDADGDKEAVADADKKKKDELPPIEQPDENDRPKTDPQLNVALLMMRVHLLGLDHPTLATADVEDKGAKIGRP